MNIFSYSKTKTFPLLILALVISAAYTPTFSGQFILDDRPLVKDNLLIREFKKPISYLFREDGVNDEGFSGHHTGYYRPLVNLLYTLDYKIWGMKASGFRITNLILHLLTCIVLYQLLFSLSGRPFIPLALTLLFGLHPVNTESVAWIAARNNILVTLFSLMSFYYYLKNRKESQAWAGLLSYLFFVVALLCKEFAIMLLPIFFLSNRLIVPDRKSIREEFLGYIPFILILCLYFLLRANIVGALLTPISTSVLWKNIYFTPFLIAYNLKLIFFPYGLHGFIIHYPNDYLSWQPFAGFFGLVLLAFLLWNKRKDKMLLFSFFSFLVALFPVLNIIPTSAVTMVSMRWLYFPMIFLFFSLVCYLEKLLNVSRFFAWCVLTIVVFYIGTYSYILNQNLWHDEDTFYNQEIINFDNKFYAGGFAESLLDNKNFEEAEKYFRIAISHYPNDAKNYINYSSLLIDTGRTDEALLYLNKTNQLTITNHERGELFNNLGMAHFHLKNQDEALKNFLKAVIFCPNEPAFWANLGGAYGSIGAYPNSISALEKGLEIAPNSLQLRKNLAVNYIRIGDNEKAISILEKIAPEDRHGMGINQVLAEARKNLILKSNELTIVD